MAAAGVARREACAERSHPVEADDNGSRVISRLRSAEFVEHLIVEKLRNSPQFLGVLGTRALRP